MDVRRGLARIPLLTRGILVLPIKGRERGSVSSPGTATILEEETEIFSCAPSTLMSSNLWKYPLGDGSTEGSQAVLLALWFESRGGSEYGNTNKSQVVHHASSIGSAAQPLLAIRWLVINHNLRA
jgi:hypothetical protein